MKPRFTITGFVIALIMVAMVFSAFGLFMSEMNAEYNEGGENVLSKYENYTSDIINQTNNIKNSSININEGGGNFLVDFIDIVAIFYNGGWNAIKVSFKSVDLFTNLMGDAASDVPAFGFFKEYIMAIVMIMIFLGVGVGILLKWRV